MDWHSLVLGSTLITLSLVQLLVMPSAVQAATPTLTVSRNSATYTENDVSFYVDPGIQITYSDTVSGAKVSIGAGFNASQDQLVYSTTGGIAGSYNATTGILTLTGAASASSYEAALQAVQYFNSSDNPTTASRVITFSLSGGSLYNETNGHYYEFVSAPGISWTNACTGAAALSLYGLQGYLATITSSQENDFLTAKVSGTAWIGASDEALGNATSGGTEGIWRWVTGPEGQEESGLGQQFFTETSGGGGTPWNGRYSNWAPGEPNNSGTGEDYCHMMTWTAPPGQWNDLADAGGGGQYASTGYVVEYGGMPGDPVLQLSASISVAAEAVNDPPVIGSIGDQSMNEDASRTVSLSATDIEGNTPITFSVSGGSVSTVTGSILGNQLTLTPGTNYFTSLPITFTVTATDSLGASSSTTFDVTVAPVNDAPSFVKGANQTVLEDCGSQVVSGWATSITAGPANESGQTLNFSVTNNNNALFSAQPSIAADGTLTFTPAADANGTATLTVMLHDNGGTMNGGVDTSVSQTFFLTVREVNDAPTAVTDAYLMPEDGTLTLTTTQLLSNDLKGPPNESGQTIVFVSLGTTPVNCTVSLYLGTITVHPTPDYSGPASFEYTIRDNGTTANVLIARYASGIVTITVNPVNDVPSFTKGADQTVAEDCSSQAVAEWATNISAGPADEAGQVLHFDVTNDNNALFSAQPAVSPTGVLTYTPAANMNGSATVSLHIHDDGGTANGGVDTSAPQTFTITVTPVNDAPVNTAAPSIAGTMNVGDTLTADPGTWNDTIDTSVSGTSTLTCTYQWVRADDASGTNAADITAATSSTYVLSNSDAHKYLRVRVTCMDNGVGLPTTQSVALSTPWNSQVINRLPVVTEGASTSITMDEDGSQLAWNLTLHATDADSDTLTWNILTPASHGTATASSTGSSKNIGYTPAGDYNGSDSFVVQVSDAYGGTAGIMVDISVTPVNDPPVNTTLPVIAGMPHVGRTLAATTGNWNDALDTDVSGTSVLSYAYQWQRSTDGGATFVDIPGATGPIYVLTLPDNLQQARIKVTCSDTGVGQPIPQSTTVFSPPVVVLNVAPVIMEGATANVTCDEDESPMPFSLTLHATDADDIDTLTWHIVTPPAHGTLAIPADPTGPVTVPVYHPASNWNGSDSFVVQVSDGYGGTAGITVTVTVNPINDAPICLGLPRVTGAAVVGTTINADAGLWDDHLDKEPGHVGLQVQWLRSTTVSGSGAQVIPNATGLTYNVREGDVGFFLGVLAIATDDGEGLPHSMQTSVEGNFIQVFDRDRVPPTVQFLHPLSTMVTTSTLILEGMVWDAMSGVRSLSIDGVPVILYAGGTFRYDLTLKRGDNVFLIVATDNTGNQWTQTYHVTYAPVVPYPVSARQTIVLTIGSKTMTVDGARVTLDAPAALVEDRTLVPLRALVEHLGGTISWNAKTRQVTLRARGTTIILTIGKSTALVNGKPLAIDPKNSKVVPILSSSRTMLPLRFVAENLSLQVGWDAKARTITVSWDD